MIEAGKSKVLGEMSTAELLAGLEKLDDQFVEYVARGDQEGAQAVWAVTRCVSAELDRRVVLH